MYFSRSEFEILHEPGEIARFDCLNPAIYILIMNHLTAEISCIFGGQWDDLIAKFNIHEQHSFSG